jgi:hypothetical protein
MFGGVFDDVGRRVHDALGALAPDVLGAPVPAFPAVRVAHLEGESAQVLQQHAGVAVGRIQGLALPVSVTLQKDGIDAVGLVHPPDFAGDELAGLIPGDALVFTFAPVVGIAVAVGIPVHPLEGVLDPVRGVDAFFVGQ